MPLTQEQIDELINKKKRTNTKLTHLNSPLQREPGWKSKELSVRKGTGPIQFVDMRGECQSGHFNEELQEQFTCRTPTYTQFQGVYYCSLHCLNLANEMLIKKEVLS